MHPEQIKAAIRMKGTTPSAIADQLEISRTTVSHVIRGTGVSERVANRIAEVTGLSVTELWPGKYTKTLTQAQKRAAFKAVVPTRRAKVERDKFGFPVDAAPMTDAGKPYAEQKAQKPKKPRAAK